MRISTVPAQITTVEDKIAGNVSVKQAVYLGIPVLIGFAVAVFLPPFGQFTGYKIGIVISLFVICGGLAFRIKDRIIAEWLKLFITYAKRPKYYVLDKNSMYLRDEPAISEHITPDVEVVKPHTTNGQEFTVSSHERTKLQKLIGSTKHSVRYEVSRKGELHVHVTEA